MAVVLLCVRHRVPGHCDGDGIPLGGPMAPGSTLHFGPFSLDGTDDGLWCGPERCTLTAKAEAVLRYLVAHPGRLVRKADLLAAVWSDAHVSDWVLTTCIRYP